MQKTSEHTGPLAGFGNYNGPYKLMKVYNTFNLKKMLLILNKVSEVSGFKKKLYNKEFYLSINSIKILYYKVFFKPDTSLTLFYL